MNDNKKGIKFFVTNVAKLGQSNYNNWPVIYVLTESDNKLYTEYPHHNITRRTFITKDVKEVNFDTFNTQGHELSLHSLKEIYYREAVKINLVAQDNWVEKYVNSKDAVIPVDNRKLRLQIRKEGSASTPRGYDNKQTFGLIYTDYLKDTVDIKFVGHDIMYEENYAGSVCPVQIWNYSLQYLLTDSKLSIEVREDITEITRRARVKFSSLIREIQIEMENKTKKEIPKEEGKTKTTYSIKQSKPASSRTENNHWEDVFGAGDEAEAAYWNTQ